MIERRHTKPGKTLLNMLPLIVLLIGGISSYSINSNEIVNTKANLTEYICKQDKKNDKIDEKLDRLLEGLAEVKAELQANRRIR